MPAMCYNLDNTTLPMSVYYEINFVSVEDRDIYLSVGEHCLFEFLLDFFDTSFSQNERAYTCASFN